jgi:hypothetical protein
MWIRVFSCVGCSILPCVGMFIMIGVLCITLELQLSVFNKDVRSRCTNHGGFHRVRKNQIFQFPLKMKAIT